MPETTDNDSAQHERPLSPHLMAYKPQMTSMLSILHRATGVALVAGTLMVAWWLIAAAYGEDAFETARSFGKSPIGLALIFGWSAALFYHMCNGIRHMFWDMGYLFKIENAYRAGYIVLLTAAILTASVWYCALNYAHEEAAPAITGDLVQADSIEGAE